MKEVIDRDEFVFAQALQNKCKIVMVPSGGYTSQSAGIISASIHNLTKKKIISVA